MSVPAYFNGDNAKRYHRALLNEKEQRLMRTYALIVLADVAASTSYQTNITQLIIDAAQATKGADVDTIRAGNILLWINYAISLDGTAKSEPNDILPIIKLLLNKSDQELDVIDAFLFGTFGQL